MPTVSLWSLPHSPRADPCCNTLAGVYFANNLLIRLKGQFVKTETLGFPGGAVVENLPANAGDTGSSPGLGRSHMPRSN